MIENPSRALQYLSSFLQNMADNPPSSDGYLDLYLHALLLTVHRPSIAGALLEELSTINPDRIKELVELLDYMPTEV